MANLDITALWADGIYQIEQEDPVLGGAPNEATGAGMVNIPHKQLAERTAWLKAAIAGIGGEAETITDLDAHVETGFRFYGSAATGNPQTGQAGLVAHVEGDGIALQQAQSAAGNGYTRLRTGAIWGAWSTMWQTAAADTSLASDGYQKLPSGLIMQWGYESIANGDTVSFPIAFPTACLNVQVTDNNQTAIEGQQEIVGVGDVTASGFDVSAFDMPTGSPTVSSNIWWLAIGH